MLDYGGPRAELDLFFARLISNSLVGFLDECWERILVTLLRLPQKFRLSLVTGLFARAGVGAVAHGGVHGLAIGRVHV